MGGAVLSPDPRMNPLNGGNKQPKVTRSSSHHGGKKKSSPVPAAQAASNISGKDHYVLVAAEAMPLGNAGTCK